MLTSEKMDRVSAAILRSDLDSVLEEVTRLGVLHPTHIGEFDEWAQSLSPTDAEQLRTDFEKRRLHLQQLMEASSAQPLTTPNPTGLSRSVPRLPAVDEAIARIEARIAPLLAAQESGKAKQTELTAHTAQIEGLLPANLPFLSLARSTFLSTAFGSLDARQLPNLQVSVSAVPSVIVPYRIAGDSADIACVVLRQDKPLLDQALRDCGFHETVLPPDLGEVSAEAKAEIARQLAEVQSSLSRIASELEAVHTEILPELQALACSVDDALTLLTLKSYCRVSDKACVFAGWVPRAQTEGIRSALSAKTNGRVLLETEDADSLVSAQGDALDVPVFAKLPAFLKPFQLLMDAYGVPAYRMLNPTLFLAISFLLMFGMMFGDVGHGLVLVSLGALLLKRGNAFRDVGKLFAYCGSSSIVFGLLYGSVFGFEEIIPTLWVKPLENATALFTVAIAFGVVVISLGLILNLVNMIRRRTVLREFFDVSGPLTTVAYWAAIGLVVKVLLLKQEFSATGLLFWLVVLPLAAFFAKGPILALARMQESPFPEGIVGYVMECAVEILEVLMGCLANTVSFIRVAAFGMAHAGLFVAIFSIADALPTGPAGAAASWLVLIVGNIAVIVLEGLVVTIQALRLEYYEFFGKFFSRTGTKYQPIAFTNTARNKAD